MLVDGRSLSALSTVLAVAVGQAHCAEPVRAGPV